MKLDPKGLEAAYETLGMPDHPDQRRPIGPAITAYLSAITSAEAGGLVERLRDMGGGEHAVATCQEAATVIEVQAAELSALRMIADSQVVSHRDFNTVRADKSESALASERAAHAETKLERDEARNSAYANGLKVCQLRNQAEAAEARLAEAMKALDGLLEPFEGDDCRYDHHGYCQAHFLQEGDECCVKIARRVCEGGKEDG